MSISYSFKRLVPLSLVALSGFVVAQPPPPPPPGFPAYVELLDNSYNGRRLEDYGNLFDNDVHVVVEGRLVSKTRIELLEMIKGEFEKNLHVRSLSWAQGSQILVMQEVDGCIPIKRNPGTVYHGCPSARAVRYDLGDNHKITAVNILNADRAWNVHPAGDKVSAF